MDEFQLIKTFFQDQQDNLLLSNAAQQGLVLGIGDDCALLDLPRGKQLAVSVDTLVNGIHFPPASQPDDIAQRALRTAASDLAAMGAEPLWFTLALTLPADSDYTQEDWLRRFSHGLFAAANELNMVLVGGDTTSSKLNSDNLCISIQVMGALSPQQVLRRDGASVGDFVCVTNYLGDGAAALAVLENKYALAPEHDLYLRERFYRPTPRFKESQLLCSIASAVIDISDGLVADLEHICKASDVGAVVEVENLPFSPALQSINDIHQARVWGLSGGDDYELCFTVAPTNMPALAMLIAEKKMQASIIGEIVGGHKVKCELLGEPFALSKSGYQHF